MKPDRLCTINKQRELISARKMSHKHNNTDPDEDVPCIYSDAGELMQAIQVCVVGSCGGFRALIASLVCSFLTF